MHQNDTDRTTCVADDLTVILPTLNEEAGIKTLLAQLLKEYPGVTIMVSDDGSTDKTREIVSSYGKPAVQLLDREHAPVHGLTASVLDAIMMVRSRYFLVMDADGQHPYQAIGPMLSCLRQGSALVIGTRAISTTQWSSSRKFFSWIASFLGRIRLALGGKGWVRADILSGFFAARTESWNEVSCAHAPESMFQLQGYKVLFDFLKQLDRNKRYAKVQYEFQVRQKDSSKINCKVILEYLTSLIR